MPPPHGADAPSEEELRAAYEAEIKRIRVESMLLENVVMLVNMGMRRTGLAPGTEDERDPQQVRVAVESVRALMPVLESFAPDEAGQVRDALSQLQLAYVRSGGQPGDPGEEPAAAGGRGGPGAPGGAGGPAGAAGGPGAPGGGAGGPGGGDGGPAQRSGRLWIPGQ
jgi:hypothetical protein